jgi:hypothetical protein
MRDIEEMARYTPASVGESSQLSSIVSTAEENRQNICKVRNGKKLFSALYGTYTVALHELKAVLRASNPAGQSKTPKSAATQEDGLKEIRRRKRHSTNETAPTSKKAACVDVDTPHKEVATRNFFAPLRASDMDTDSTNTEATSREAAAPAKPSRPPPIVLTSAVNLILLQKQLKGVVSENFQFRNTRNGTRVNSRSMADFQSVKPHFDSQNLSYYSFFTKSEKDIKAVIRHLQHNTPGEDILDGLFSVGFDVSIKQMTVTRRLPPEEYKIINLPMFLVTLPRTVKSQEIFRLSSLCHTAIRVDAYRSQNALTQCHNCQQYGHVWQTASSLPAACGAEAVTYTTCAPRKEIHLPLQHAATGGWRKEKTPFPQIIGAADMRRRCRKRSGIQDYNGEGVLFKIHHSRHILRGGAPRQDRGTAAASDTSVGSGRSQPVAFSQHKQQKTI